MRFLSLLLGSALLTGCVGTRILEVDPSSEADMHLVIENAKAQSGEIVEDAVRFEKGKLYWSGDALMIAPADGSPLRTINLRPVERPFDIRLRYRGSPLGALIGLLAGTGAGYGAGRLHGCGGGGSVGEGLVCLGITAGGGLLGAILGAFLGPKKTTVYRFRPNAARQLRGHN